MNELVTPLNMLKSNMVWDKDDEGNTFMIIRDVPVMKYVENITEKDVDEFDRFIQLITSQYDYMKEILDKKD